MVTTSGSHDYTVVALRSLLAHTPFQPGDLVVVVDNDGDFIFPAEFGDPQVVLHRPDHPRGFASNANWLLATAREHGADLFLLDNDIVFTSDWSGPLLVRHRALISAASNSQFRYRKPGWAIGKAMALADFAGHEDDLEQISRRHSSTESGYQIVSTVPFYCMKIPREVYEIVGGFDESFDQDGGADGDYAVRAWLAGYRLELALASYVLHFQGRSPFGGPEMGEQPLDPGIEEAKRFRDKWGASLTYAFLQGNWNLFRSDPDVARAVDKLKFGVAAERLRQQPALEPFIQRQLNATFGAVCCLYDDDQWLAPAVESIYDACETIWFLVSDRPWHGEPSSQDAMVDRLRELPDPAGKLRVVRGSWPDEATQRNAGMQFLADAGLDYCLVVDADEIHDPAQLCRVMQLARESPRVECWRMQCLTYWKSSNYRVDPPEPFAAAVVVRVGTVRFVENRVCESHFGTEVPAEVGVFHHMSYARTDEYLFRKIATFSHAHQVVPGWFENVWRRWDGDHTLENLHPCWPAAYRRVVEQPYDALPPALRRVRDREGLAQPLTQ